MSLTHCKWFDLYQSSLLIRNSCMFCMLMMSKFKYLFRCTDCSYPGRLHSRHLVYWLYFWRSVMSRSYAVILALNRTVTALHDVTVFLFECVFIVRSTFSPTLLSAGTAFSLRRGQCEIGFPRTARPSPAASGARARCYSVHSPWLDFLGRKLVNVDPY